MSKKKPLKPSKQQLRETQRVPAFLAMQSDASPVRKCLLLTPDSSTPSSSSLAPGSSLPAPEDAPRA
jgi:hypothetical protein